MSISGRVALLSFIFVILAEILVLVPAIAYNRLNLLQERIDDAALVADALLTNPNRVNSIQQSERLMQGARVLNIAINYEDRRELLLTPPQSIQITNTVKIMDLTFFNKMKGAFSCIASREGDITRLVGQARYHREFLIDTTILREPLCDQVKVFAWRFFFVSLFIAMLAGAVLYAAIRRILVKPLLHLTNAITNYTGSISDDQIIKPKSGMVEIHAAETSLSEMQRRISRSIGERSRLATVGSSVAKIQHDLRNILAAADLLADGLANSPDPKVRKNAPRIGRAINRALTLSTQTLEYGRLGQRPPKYREINIIPICQELIEEEKYLGRDFKLEWDLNAPQAQILISDQEFFRRVYSNLIRNARQILCEGEGGKITTRIYENDEAIYVEVRDDGPGVSDAAAEFLFEPFKGSTRQGGTGLGLALAHELCEMMSANLELVEQGDGKTSGACFAIVFAKNAQIRLAKRLSEG